MSGMAQAGHDSRAGLENGTGPKQPDNGLIQICADAVFHLDVLKPALPEGDAGNGPLGAGTKKQMTLDLDDWW